MLTPFAILAFVAHIGGAQNSDSLKADSAFRRSDWPAVAQLYSAIAQRNPQQGMAWMRVGFAKQALGEVDPAIAAFEKALALNWQVPAATLRLARLYSKKGDMDHAFAALQRLVPLRSIPLAVLDTFADLAPARRDPRYKSIADGITALRYPCRSKPEALQLDFWIGDWNVTPWQAPSGSNPALIGTNKIEPILEHCVLMENWSGGPPGGVGGGFGKSMNFFDTNRNQWRQIWMADGGGSLDYAGSFKEGAMRFEGWTLAPNGGRVLQKLTFFPISKDTVRQVFENSADSGKTWTPGFDGRYVRKP
jgi:tetratricopeptide (TPR) repeat protein